LEALSISDNFVDISKKIGVHAVADILGVDSNDLQDEKFLMTLLRNSLQVADFTILDEKSLKFPGEHSGVTGFFILSESHAAFHSYPEYHYLGVDIFSCGKADPKKAIQHLSKMINAQDLNISLLNRGLKNRENKI
tara:strand:+ start:69 stop:476 length:408 start_codon:yes stop_codon:yes gene_type:complete